MVDGSAAAETAHRPVRAPAFYLQAMEGRALIERASVGLAWPLLAQAARGDGHHVLVMPGFNTSDRSTRLLRRYLSGLGYAVHGWGFGRNLGPTPKVLAGLEELIPRIAAQAGRPISLVGWSLGGLYAREFARDHPDLIRYVATLGSPFRMRPGDTSTASFLAARYGRNFEAAPVPPREETRDRLTMPTSAIYSKTDGFVRWQLCVDDATGEHENIQVRGSHMGLPSNPLVMLALADRLSRVSGGREWEKFRPASVFRALYPPPRSWALQPASTRI